MPRFWGSLELCKPGLLPMGLRLLAMGVVVVYALLGHPFEADKPLSTERPEWVSAARR